MSRRRLTPIILVLALSAPLAGCGGGGGFDPTDLLSFLDNKKPLPGERRPVFPEGVPGVDRGVPPDMVKGSPGATAVRQQIEQAQQPQLQPQQQPGATQTAVAPAEDEAPPATSPPPAAARPKAPAKRRSVTAPPPEPAPAQATQQAQPAPASSSPFPPPVQSGTFTR